MLGRSIVGGMTIVAALVLVSLAAPGIYVPPPPGDCCPQWSPGGTQIVFTTERPNGIPVVGAVSSLGGPEQTVHGIPIGTRSPDWTHVAYTTESNGKTWLTVANVDGSGSRQLAETNGDFAWSPDSERLAFVGADQGLWVVHTDGSGLGELALGPAATPVWRPDQRLIAFVVTGTSGGVSEVGSTPFGRPDHTVVDFGTKDPRWSSDGRAFSYVDGRTITVEDDDIDNSTLRFVVPSPPLRYDGFFPDGKALLYEAAPAIPPGRNSIETGTLVNGRLFQDGLVRIDLPTGTRQILSFGDGATFSRDGTRLAFSSGGECRDRRGIYVMNADGTGRQRLTNDCAIRGTRSADTLYGTPLADVLLGLGGDDRLYANDPGYVGDTLKGGPGNDLLVGGYRQDTLDGGPGNDTLDGGPSGDTLTGGPGHDHLNGQGGADVIDAVDGQRDWITCGANAYGKDGRDVVDADRVDVVASDCEVVHRR